MKRWAKSVIFPDLIKEICYDRNLQQWKELYNIAEELGVTISNLIHRLKDLGWIELKENSREIELKKRVASTL